MTNRPFSRRKFLRGLGVTMALPWMESLPVWDALAAPGLRPASQAPVRLGVLFGGNGFHSKEWWAKGEGNEMELGRVLEPLTDFRERMLFIRGLHNAEALKGNIHSSQTGNLLSGAPLADGGEIRSGTSFDQVVAQSYGRSTKVPSLVVGCERSNPGIHKNYSMLYSSHISWSSPTASHPAGSLSRPGFRPAVQGQRPARRPERAGCGAGRSPSPAPGHRAPTINTSWTST